MLIKRKIISPAKNETLVVQPILTDISWLICKVPKIYITIMPIIKIMVILHY